VTGFQVDCLVLACVGVGLITYAVLRMRRAERTTPARQPDPIEVVEAWRAEMRDIELWERELEGSS
jgi:hypothetical protein